MPHPQKPFILNSKFSEIPCEKINQRSNCLCVWVKLLFYQIDFSHCAAAAAADASSARLLLCRSIYVLSGRDYSRQWGPVLIYHVYSSAYMYRHRHQVFIDRQCQIRKREKTTEISIQSIFKNTMAECTRLYDEMDRVWESLLKSNIDRFFFLFFHSMFGISRFTIYWRTSNEREKKDKIIEMTEEWNRYTYGRMVLHHPSINAWMYVAYACVSRQWENFYLTENIMQSNFLSDFLDILYVIDWLPAHIDGEKQCRQITLHVANEFRAFHSVRVMYFL